MISYRPFRDTYLHPSEIRILTPPRYVSAPLQDTYLQALKIRICKHPRYVSANTQDTYLQTLKIYVSAREGELVVQI